MDKTTPVLIKVDKLKCYGCGECYGEVFNIADRHTHTIQSDEGKFVAKVKEKYNSILIEDNAEIDTEVCMVMLKESLVEDCFKYMEDCPAGALNIQYTSRTKYAEKAGESKTEPKPVTTCVFCLALNPEIEYNGRLVCVSCAKDLNKKRKAYKNKTTKTRPVRVTAFNPKQFTKKLNKLCAEFNMLLVNDSIDSMNNLVKGDSGSLINVMTLCEGKYYLINEKSTTDKGDKK